jgi:hypothetical protein
MTGWLHTYARQYLTRILLAVHVTGAAVEGPDELLLAELLLGALSRGSASEIKVTRIVW